MKKLVVSCEIFSRVTGYFRPVNNWNDGKREEFKDRVAFSEKKSLASAKAIELVAVH
jgi:ribonucleoside-triphosphate reductase